MRRKRSFIWLILILLFVFVFTNQRMSLFALVLLCVMLFASLLLRNRIAGGLKVTFDVLEQGGRPVLRIRAKNNGFLPANCIQCSFSCENVVFRGKVEQTVNIGVAGKSETVMEFPIGSIYCGRIDVEMKRIEMYDWLGVTKKELMGQGSGCCYCYPPIREYYMENPDYNSSEGEEITYRHVAGYDVSEILQIREYRKGDSIKNIHWKISAKMGETMVKELDCPNDNTIMLLFDYLPPEEKNKNNRIIAAVSNISRELCGRQEGHTVYRMNTSDNIVVSREIFEYEEYDCLLQELLETEAKDSVYKVSDYVMDSAIFTRYAKIMYITAEDALVENDLTELGQCVVVAV